MHQKLLVTNVPIYCKIVRRIPKINVTFICILTAVFSAKLFLFTSGLDALPSAEFANKAGATFVAPAG